MLNLFRKDNKEKLNKILKSISKNDIVDLRRKVKILMVDDEEYAIFKLLNTRGYRMYYKSDINYVEEVEPFDIVILDIKGVAQEYGSTYEGFGFAIEVKKLYPNKIVLCYSGTSDNNINSQLDKIDGYISKDTDIDQWTSRLDSLIRKYSSVDYHWDIINRKLIENHYPEETIEELRKLYIKSFNEDSFDELKNEFMSNINDAKMCIEVLTSLVSLIKLLA